MIRTHKKQLIIASLLILLPALVGMLLMDRLPEAFSTHWGVDGQADGYSSRGFAVFAPPVIMLAMFWLCVFFTAKDPGNQGRNRKPMAMVLWIIPILSNLCNGIMYALALGVDFSVTNVMVAFMGLIFAVIGNYLPKCQTNSTIGIKVPWAYTSEENWNATHRFGGRVWVIGGIAILLFALIPGETVLYVMLVSVFVMAFIPIFYSWRYYKKQLARGSKLRPLPLSNTRITTGSLIAVAILIAAVSVILFVGDVDVVFGEDSFTVEADFYDDLTVDYSAVDGVEYRDGNVPGSRVWGFGSLRLLLGFFENEEFGAYTRYTYTGCDACIVLTVGEKVLVISGDDAADTQAIYQTLLERTAK